METSRKRSDSVAGLVPAATVTNPAHSVVLTPPTTSRSSGGSRGGSAAPPANAPSNHYGGDTVKLEALKTRGAPSLVPLTLDSENAVATSEC